MKNLVIILVVLALLGGGYYLVSNKSQKAPEPTVSNQAPTSAPTEAMKENTMMKKDETAAVTLTANGFEPATVTVKVGEKIIWTNKSGSTSTVHSDPHPVHTSYKHLNLGRFDDGATLEFTATEPGTYQYHDHLHPQRTGTVVVK